MNFFILFPNAERRAEFRAKLQEWPGLVLTDHAYRFMLTVHGVRAEQLSILQALALELQVNVYPDFKLEFCTEPA